MYKYFTAVFLAVTACASAPVHADSIIGQCQPSQPVYEGLSKVGGVRVFSGVQDGGKSILEVWVIDDMEWFAMLSTPDGMSCALAYGADYMFSNRKPNA